MLSKTRTFLRRVPIRARGGFVLQPEAGGPATREEREQLEKAKIAPSPERKRVSKQKFIPGRSKVPTSKNASSHSSTTAVNANASTSSTSRSASNAVNPNTSASSTSRSIANAITARDTGSANPPSANSEEDALDVEVVDGPAVNEKNLSAAAREARLVAPLYEGKVAISRAAKASVFGWTLAEGYEGFKYVSSFRKGDKGYIKESWKCLKCGQPKTASGQGKPTNLKKHAKICSGPKDEAARARLSAANEADAEKASAAAQSTTLAGSYNGQSVTGWLSAHQALNTDLARRLGLISVIKNALPFTHLASDENKAMVRSLDHRATTSMKGAKAVRSDLKRFHSILSADLIKEIRGIDSLIALQHDAWTNRGFQHSFVAIVGSYVDSQWIYHERLLSFDVVRQKHTGATFAGHLVRTLKALDLDDKWYGCVTSDSAGTNIRMMDLLQEDLMKEGMQERSSGEASDDAAMGKMMRKSCSAFPKASLRNYGYWNPGDCKILCLNHHINLEIRDGFTSFGVNVKTKTQQKVLDIRPKPHIAVFDENGDRVAMDSAVDMDGATDDDGDEDEEDLSEKGDGEDLGNESGAEIDGNVSDEEEDDDESVMEPDKDDIGSDDGGGPGAEEEEDSDDGDGKDAADDDTESGRRGTRSPLNAVKKLEHFSTWIHRGGQRRADFRARMHKEYHKDPELANAPFPPKPNKTRWNSHYAMIRAALKIREAIDAHCRASIGVRGEKIGKYLLTDVQWRQLNVLEPTLRLAGAVTKKMEKSEGTLYAVLDHHASLRDDIARHIRTTSKDASLDDQTKAEVIKFLNAVEAKLRNYRDIALKNRTVLAATLLHPDNRKLFKLSYPKYRIKAEEAVRSLLIELVDITSKEPPPALQPAATSTKNVERLSPCSAARARREQEAAAEETEDEVEDDDEVTKYLNPEICPWRATDGTPYKWWRDNEALFPNVSKLARIILAIPGSSSAVERVFSQAALVSTNRRGSLSSGTISELVKTRHWLNHGANQLAGLPPQALNVAHTHERLPHPEDKYFRKK
ncbi:hypothetical protein CF319_g8042 [Tilletia indica]|nr:hypothetical protein CF319_g8042 [Tilletia indica]